MYAPASVPTTTTIRLLLRDTLTALAYRAVNLTEEEVALYEKLRPIFAQYQDIFRRDIEAGRTPDYGRIEIAVLQVVTPGLLDYRTEKLAELEEQIGVVTDLAARVPQDELERIRQVVDGITETTRAEVSAIAQQYALGGMSDETLRKLFETALGANRVATIIATERTNARRVATLAYRDEVAALGGPTLAPFVWTRRDDRVCDVCGPKHRQPAEDTTMEDGTFWPGVGFPAYHPRCRCDLRLRRAVPFSGTTPAEGPAPPPAEPAPPAPTPTEALAAHREQVLARQALAPTVPASDHADEAQYQQDLHWTQVRHQQARDHYVQRASADIAEMSADGQTPTQAQVDALTLRHQIEWDNLSGRQQRDMTLFADRYAQRQTLRTEARQVISEMESQNQNDIEQIAAIREQRAALFNELADLREQLAHNPESQAAIQRKITLRRKKSDTLLQQIVALEDGHAQRMHPLLLATSEPKPMPFSYDGDVSDVQVQTLQDATAFVGHLLDPSLSRTAIHLSSIPPHESQRAFCRGTTVHLPSTEIAPRKTAVHELGHAIEHQNPQMAERIDEFLLRRTEQSALVQMREVTGNADYGEHEWTRPNAFRHAYIGKEYRRNGERIASEVLSMGLEYFYHDPLGFARADPDMFELIYLLVKGGTAV